MIELTSIIVTTISIMLTLVQLFGRKDKCQ